MLFIAFCMNLCIFTAEDLCLLSWTFQISKCPSWRILRSLALRTTVNRFVERNNTELIVRLGYSFSLITVSLVLVVVVHELIITEAMSSCVFAVFHTYPFVLNAFIISEQQMPWHFVEHVICSLLYWIEYAGGELVNTGEFYLIY